MTRTRFAAAILMVVAVLVGCGNAGQTAGAASGGSDATLTVSSQPDIKATPDEYAKIEQLQPNGPAAEQSGLSIQVVGDRNTPGGLKLRSSGFPANGHYQTQAWYPDGSEYDHLKEDGYGRVDAYGGTPFWTWDLLTAPLDPQTGQRVDPPGQYRVRIYDRTPGSPTQNLWVETTFIL